MVEVDSPAAQVTVFDAVTAHQAPVPPMSPGPSVLVVSITIVCAHNSTVCIVPAAGGGGHLAPETLYHPVLVVDYLKWSVGLAQYFHTFPVHDTGNCNLIIKACNIAIMRPGTCSLASLIYSQMWCTEG